MYMELSYLRLFMFTKNKTESTEALDIQHCLPKLCFVIHLVYEPVRDKTNNLGFRPSPTQASLYSHRSRLEARNFGFK